MLSPARLRWPAFGHSTVRHFVEADDPGASLFPPLHIRGSVAIPIFTHHQYQALSLAKHP
jgi:hypothetical protein